MKNEQVKFDIIFYTMFSPNCIWRYKDIVEQYLDMWMMAINFVDRKLKSDIGSLTKQLLKWNKIKVYQNDDKLKSTEPQYFCIYIVLNKTVWRATQRSGVVIHSPKINNRSRLRKRCPLSAQKRLSKINWGASSIWGIHATIFLVIRVKLFQGSRVLCFLVSLILWSLQWYRTMSLWGIFVLAN